MIRRALIVALVVTLCAPAASAAPTAGSENSGVIGLFKLPGALDVLTSEDHTKPVVVVDTFIAAGSSSDFAGEEGIAAATAFAIWNGGKQAPGDQVAALGGKSRVIIERSATIFEAELPADQVEAGVAAIGDAFSHPNWSALDLARTTAALHAAALEASGDPDAQALQRFMSTSFPRDVGHAVYGQDFQPARGDLQAFFDRYYVPASANVVLAGDFDTGRIVGNVVRGYAAMLARTPSLAPLPTRPIGPPAPNTLRPLKALFILGAKGPDLANQREQASLELLGKVLAGTPGSRIERALATLGGARVVSSRWLRSAGPGLLLIELEVDSASVEPVRKQLQEILAELRANPVSLDEHAKAMAAVLADEEPRLQELGPRALAIGISAIAAHDPYWVRTYPEEIRQVSRQDVMAAAQKYLPPSVSPIVILP